MDLNFWLGLIFYLNTNRIIDILDLYSEYYSGRRKQEDINMFSFFCCCSQLQEELLKVVRDIGKLVKND